MFYFTKIFHCKNIQCLLLAVLLSLPFVAHAYTGVTIVITEDSAENQDFVDAFKQEISTNKNSVLKVSVLLLKDADKLELAENSELVVALGTKALYASSKLKHTTPVLSVFTPSLEFNRILADSKRNYDNFSAVMLDQPYARQLMLIKNVLPAAKNVSMLLGSSSTQYAKLYQETAQKKSFNIRQHNIYQQAEIIPKLKQSFNESDVFLAVADEHIFNSDTAKSIILMSYQYQKPIFAFSQAFVQAGALASVYSEIKQVAKQSAEIAIKSHKAPALLPPPQTPKYFSVMVNHQVAHMLNIAAVDEKAVKTHMLEAEAN
jgi:ABC-type uncharacterized transport system substrate-binding protein